MQKVIFLESSNFHQKKLRLQLIPLWWICESFVSNMAGCSRRCGKSCANIHSCWSFTEKTTKSVTYGVAKVLPRRVESCVFCGPWNSWNSYISKAWLVGYLKCINAKAFIVTLKILGRTCWIVLIAPFEVSMLKFWTSKSFQKFHVSPNSYQFSHKSVAMREAFLHPFGSILNEQVFCHHDIRQDTWESFWLLRFCWTNSFNLCSIGWISAHCLDTQHSCVPRWCHTSVYGRLWFRAKVKLLLSTDEAKCQIDPSVISWFWLLRLLVASLFFSSSAMV